MVSKEELRARLETIIDPTCNKTLKETGGLKHVGIDDEVGRAVLVIALEKKDNDEVKQFKINLTKLIKLDLGFSGLKLEIEELNPKEKGTVLDKEKQIRYIGIASGKGGVGKSTVAANIAVTLAKLGHKVGIIDADIYGPSIPNVMGIEVKLPKGTKDEKVLPYAKYNVEVISTAFFVEDNAPLMWRGPMLNRMLSHFFYDVKWNDKIEFIIVDLPPGTGDVALDIQALIPQCEMIVVTTPHPTASNIAVKAGYGAKKLNHEIIGVIENMSYFINPVNGQKENIFGTGGGEEVASKLGVPLLGQLPIGQPKSGHQSIYSLEEPIGHEYLKIVNQLIKK
ncbi:MAG: ylxH [Haloplasmataceae bacterium]|nr:ylxH [Haloplasmataceae bacterium]